MKFFEKYGKYSSSVLRLALGLAFIVHGWQKVSGLEGWVGMAAGLGIPSVLAYLIAFGELLGGAGILLGALTRLASAGIAVIMIGALFIAGLQMSYSGGWELIAAYLGIAISLSLTGAGELSVDKKMNW